MPRYALTRTGIRKGLDAAAAGDRAIARAIDRLGYPEARRIPEGLASLVRIIVSQQVSTHAARSIFAKVEAAVSDLDDPAAVLRVRRPRLRRAGLSAAKLEAVRAVARAVDDGHLDLTALRKSSDDDAREAITAIRGLGPWSANVYMMFALGRPDLWPAGDLGVREGMRGILELEERPTPKRCREHAERWRPFRSSVALLCWRQVNTTTE